MKCGSGGRNAGPGPGLVRSSDALSSLWIVLLAGSVLAGCSRPLPEDGARDVPRLHGCWSVEVTATGAAADSVAAWLPDGSLPTVVALDTVERAVSSEGDTLFAARSYYGARQRQVPFSTWRRAPGDSLLVYRPGALAGYTMRLAPENGHLGGVLTSFTDVMEEGRPTQRRAPVRATPASCPVDGSAAAPSPDP